MREEGFVSRWSRRKQAIKNEAETSQLKHSEADVDADNTSSQQGQPPSAEDRQAALDALTDADMPDLETLDETSDYAGFMSMNVSEELRKLALRKLFHSETYNIRDGLDEYDGDYTHFEKLDSSIITADMQHRLEQEDNKLLADTDEDEDAEVIMAEASSSLSDRQAVTDDPQVEADQEENRQVARAADNQINESQADQPINTIRTANKDMT